MVVDVENGKGHVKVEEIQTKRGGLKNEILIPPSLHARTHTHAPTSPGKERDQGGEPVLRRRGVYNQ